MKYNLITQLETNLEQLTKQVPDTTENGKVIVETKNQIHQMKLELIADRLTEYEYQFCGIQKLKGTTVDKVLTVLNANGVIKQLCKDYDIHADDGRKIAEIVLKRIEKTTF